MNSVMAGIIAMVVAWIEFILDSKYGVPVRRFFHVIRTKPGEEEPQNVVMGYVVNRSRWTQCVVASIEAGLYVLYVLWYGYEDTASAFGKGFVVFAGLFIGFLTGPYARNLWYRRERLSQDAEDLQKTGMVPYARSVLTGFWERFTKAPKAATASSAPAAAQSPANTQGPGLSSTGGEAPAPQVEPKPQPETYEEKRRRIFKELTGRELS